MNEFGHYSLFLLWLFALSGLVVGIYAGVLSKRRPQAAEAWFWSTRNITLAAAICAACSVFALGWLFHYDVYSNQYVWQFSNRDMSPLYKVSAIWGGMDGSMLLWCFFLATCGGVAALQSTGYSRQLGPWVLAAINSSSLFFSTVTLFVTNPFRYIQASFIPPDGNGLNPLLQNPFMAVHPPTLYVGFTAHAVPYAFCIAALAAGQLNNDWIRLTRRWALFAWMFLTGGIILGGYWAYIELGWGGFWAWDPVENSSFLPWLTSTAFLHSIMVQERKNMLRSWNVWLIVVSYALTVFGTFLTRSGVVQSVHAFASTDVGWVFLLYLGIVIAVAAWLTWFRRAELRSEKKIESFWSREAFFLLNNLALLSICFATLWGVIFPVLSEAVTGQKQAVGIPYFNAVNVPLFLFLIALMGVGPLIAWRRASMGSLVRTFAVPLASALAVAVLLVLVGGVTEFYPVLSYALCFFVLMTILGEIHRGARAQRVTSTGENSGYVSGVSRLLYRHRIRYGAYLVHTGVLVMTVAITASMAHKLEQEFTLSQGEQFDVRRFSLILTGIEARDTANYDALHAIVAVKDRKTGRQLHVLEPELRRYRRNGESTTEVALLKSWRDDLYLIISGLDESGVRASFKVFVNPLQSWLWAGAFIMLAGTIVVLIPRAAPVRVQVPEGAGAVVEK